MDALNSPHLLSMKAEPKLRKMLEMDAANLVKWLIKTRYEGHRRGERCRYCPESTISTHHIDQCRMQQTRFRILTGVEYEEFQNRLQGLNSLLTGDNRQLRELLDCDRLYSPFPEQDDEDVASSEVTLIPPVFEQLTASKSDTTQHEFKDIAINQTRHKY